MTERNKCPKCGHQAINESFLKLHLIKRHCLTAVQVATLFDPSGMFGDLLGGMFGTNPAVDLERLNRLLKRVPR